MSDDNEHLLEDDQISERLAELVKMRSSRPSLKDDRDPHRG